MAKIIPSKIPYVSNIPIDPLQLFNIYNNYIELKKISEQESTKREAIRAHTEVELERLRHSREILESVLAETFSTRREAIKNFFDCLEKAIEDGDNEKVAIFSSQIVNIIKESPLKQAFEVLKMVNDKSTNVIDI